MKLSDLTRGLDLHAPPGTDPDVTGVTRDSREVARGTLFVAVTGARHDGRAYIEDAVGRGASVVVMEPASGSPPAAAVPILLVPDAREALARLAAAFYRAPSESLLVAGITGTNGKTTTAFLSASVLEAGGLPTGLLGSIVYRLGGEEIRAELTTPEAHHLQQMMSRMVQAGRKACVLEVSSHGMAQKRVLAVSFDLGLFTNLATDHLDFHGDAEHYFRAKAAFFEMLPATGTAILNADDGAFARMRSLTRASILTFSTGGKADLRLAEARCTTDGTAVVVQSPVGELAMESRLVGRHNVQNILAACAVGCAASIKPDAIVKGVEALARVPGRLEPVDRGQPFKVWVDFAHTAHALSNCLRSLREIAPSRIIVIFGCGGDRDQGRRAAMGAEAARLADLAVITSDNPRSEDPLEIIAQVEQGARSVKQGRYVVCADRRAAIRLALKEAHKNDVVLIAGKGHETFQIVGDRRTPMDDRLEAARALGEMGYGT